MSISTIYKFYSKVNKCLVQLTICNYRGEAFLTLYGESCLPSAGSEYKLLHTFEFIKAASDTVLDMINAAYYDKPLIFIGATFQKNLVSHHQAVNRNF